jgi:hypothetical protein
MYSKCPLIDAAADQRYLPRRRGRYLPRRVNVPDRSRPGLVADYEVGVVARWYQISRLPLRQ